LSIQTAEDLFIEELKDIYSAEKQAVQAYPRLAKRVESDELKQALQTHLEQTKEQVNRLERIFELLDQRGGRKTCEGMKGLLQEAAQHVEEIEPGPVLDAALIGALQRVEHYEIAAYGTVATLAESMGQEEVKELLGETLQEEKDTDELLTGVAQNVNTQALETDDVSEDEAMEEEEAPKKASNKPKKSGKQGASKKRGR